MKTSKRAPSPSWRTSSGIVPLAGVLFVGLFACGATSSPSQSDESDLTSTSARSALECDGARLEDICWTTTGQRGTYPYDQVVIDSGCRQQLIAYGDAQKSSLLSRGLIFANASGEAILPNLRSIPQSSDLIDQTFAFSSNGRVLYVKRSRDTLKVESFRTSQPTGGVYSQHEQVGDYTFVDCHQRP